MSHRKTITVGLDDVYYNIPTVIEGKEVSSKEATDYAIKNKTVGKGFSSIKEAVDSAHEVSKEQGRTMRGGATKFE